MDTRSALLIGALGVAVGAYACWRVLDSYYHTHPTDREKALWKRIADLQAILHVPPMFWHVWARYTDELTHSATRGKHAANRQANEQQTPSDRSRPGDERDCRP
ncbi:MAG: hypothetical protein JO281_02540 [Pseudonocardiales bacterium]|nr:hypothetical protein [Pseudonocardiales bacterium]